MITPSLENYLNNFGQKVVNDAKKRLQSAKGSTDLGKSIRFKVVPTATGFETKFYMDSYGSYLDKGVSGNKVKQSYTNTKGETVPSPGKGYTTKQPPPGILSKWIKKKGIKGRDKKSGRFITTMSLAFIIGRKIKRDGIKSLSFFQKPFGVEYDKLKKDILDILKLDIQNYITTFTK
tara:strand:- start:61 stop:591 length:531 start_codon:yes stop_codon:yes gene_type:complete